MAVKSKNVETTTVVDPAVNPNQNDQNQNQKPSTDPIEGEKPEEGEDPATDSENKTLEDKGGMTFEQAEIEMKIGVAVKLPEWEGFWFKEIAGNQDQTFVLTKEGQVLDTPDEKYKERNDWQIAEATDKQAVILEKFWEQHKNEKEAKKENEKLLATKITQYNRSFDGAFEKVPHKLTYEDVLGRKNIPVDAIELLLEDGRIFNVPSFTLTNKKR